MAENIKLVRANKSMFGYYSNPWDTWSDQRWKAALYFMTTARPADSCPVVGDPNLDIDLPMQQPRFGPPFVDSEEGIRFTWLGHASCLFHINGLNCLCDPIMSQRCARVGNSRYRPFPCKLNDLPTIHVVVISHNHYDHLDIPTIRQLGKLYPNAQWCVPNGCGNLIANAINQNGAPHSRIWEAEWWDELTIGDNNGLKIAFTPTQHWSGRNVIFDSNRSLWGSWTFIGKNHRAWFGGDTGYCSVFKEIGEVYGPFDVAAIPIGAYLPREYLHPQHVAPHEAVQIHQDIGATHSVAIHWGTFNLGREPYMGPKADLQTAAAAAGLSDADFRTVHHGQSLCYRRIPEESLVLE